MDTARQRSTGKRVIARAFENTPEHIFVDIHDFECEICGSQYSLCSFRPHNKKAAYFSIAANEHEVWCTHVGTDDNSSQTTRSDVTDVEEGRPRDAIERLVLHQPTRTDAKHGGEASRKPQRATGAASKSTRADHARTASSLRPIVEDYIGRPEQLADKPLQIPGCPARTYRDVVRVLHHIPGKQYSTRRIYFGRIGPKSEITENIDRIEICFMQGERGASGKKFRLGIYTAGWMTSAVAHVRRDLERARRMSGESASPDGEEGEGQWIFFIGDPNVDDPFELRTDHCLALCTIAWKYEKLPRGDEGLVAVTSEPNVDTASRSRTVDEELVATSTSPGEADHDQAEADTELEFTDTGVSFAESVPVLDTATLPSMEGATTTEEQPGIVQPSSETPPQADVVRDVRSVNAPASPEKPGLIEIFFQFIRRRR